MSLQAVRMALLPAGCLPAFTCLDFAFELSFEEKFCRECRNLLVWAAAAHTPAGWVGLH